MTLDTYEKLLVTSQIATNIIQYSGSHTCYRHNSNQDTRSHMKFKLTNHGEEMGKVGGKGRKSLRKLWNERAGK